MDKNRWLSLSTLIPAITFFDSHYIKGQHYINKDSPDIFQSEIKVATSNIIPYSSRIVGSRNVAPALSLFASTNLNSESLLD